MFLNFQLETGNDKFSSMNQHKTNLHNLPAISHVRLTLRRNWLTVFVSQQSQARAIGKNIIIPIVGLMMIVDCHSSRPHKLRARKHNMWKLRWAGFNYDLISYLIQLFELLNFSILPILANEWIWIFPNDEEVIITDKLPPCLPRIWLVMLIIHFLGILQIKIAEPVDRFSNKFQNYFEIDLVRSSNPSFSCLDCSSSVVYRLLT